MQFSFTRSSSSIFSDHDNLCQTSVETFGVYRSLMIESIVSIVFCVVGVVGAYREHYCCTVLFSVFTTMLVVGEVYAAIIAPIFWMLAFLYICVTLIAFSFARLIRERMLASILMPRTAFMRDNGQTYGLRFNAYQFVNRSDDPFLQLRTVEFNGRHIPPFYCTDSMPTALAFDAVPPPKYEDVSPNPPSYQESVNNARNSDREPNGDNRAECIMHI